MIVRYFLIAAPVALSATLISACGGPSGREIAIEAGASGSQMFFRPYQVSVKPGENVVFLVKNVDNQDHEFESDEAGFGEVLIPAGSSRKIPWTAPASATTIEVECDLPGHKAAGMVMVVAVE